MDDLQRKRPVIRRTLHPSGTEVFSFDSVLLKNWIVKASASSQDSILVVMKNVKTEEVLTYFFSDEVQANDFINFHTQI